jgi:hypothetical protein
MAVAAVFWLRKQANTGSIIGAGIVLMCAVLFAVAERVDTMREQEKCYEQGIYCPYDVGQAFDRMAVFGIIGFAQVAALFLIGGKVESHLARRHYDPEWR